MLLTTVPSIDYFVVGNCTYLKLGDMYYKIVIPVFQKFDG